jgi:putative ABC transport system ATP-binding protein
LNARSDAEECPLIDLVGVHKTYDTGRLAVHALRGVDLQIGRGEMIALMGPSGSGKTTLLEILGCLSRPSAGSYRFRGRAIDQVDADVLASLRGEEIGFVFQSFNLLPRMTAIENVELPLAYRRVPSAERRERAARALERVGLEPRAEHRPSELSGGERQRVAIARALVNRPSVILADEPTGNLDTKTGDEIVTLLQDLHREGNTLVLVTHDRAIGERAQRRLEIQDGMIESDHRVSGAPHDDR